jgi:hypothetical protein
MQRRTDVGRGSHRWLHRAGVEAAGHAPFSSPCDLRRGICWRTGACLCRQPSLSSRTYKASISMEPGQVRMPCPSPYGQQAARLGSHCCLGTSGHPWIQSERCLQPTRLQAAMKVAAGRQTTCRRAVCSHLELVTALRWQWLILDLHNLKSGHDLNGCLDMTHCCCHPQPHIWKKGHGRERPVLEERERWSPSAFP